MFKRKKTLGFKNIHLMAMVELQKMYIIFFVYKNLQ
jgi:hypothetical protein